MNEALTILRQMMSIESMYVNHYGRNHREIDCNEYLAKLQEIYNAITLTTLDVTVPKPKQTRAKKVATND